MDSVLVTITVLSLLTTVIMATVAWHLFRDERRRIEARVAALAASLDHPEQEAHPVAPMGLLHRNAATLGHVTPPADADRARPHPDEDDGNPWGFLEDESDAPPQPSPAAAFDLFTTTAEPDRDVARRLMPAVAAGVLFVGLALASILFLTGTGPAATSAATLPRTAAPLELVSLRHANEDGRFVVTGLVRNPTGASPLGPVTAVAFFFAPDGAFLGSERQRVDVATLAPGDESPFAIATRASGIARYRISFRTTDDRPLPHVDLRGKD